MHLYTTLLCVHFSRMMATRALADETSEKKPFGYQETSGVGFNATHRLPSTRRRRELNEGRDVGCQRRGAFVYTSAYPSCCTEPR
jgi:hypothetical protein